MSETPAIYNPPAETTVNPQGCTVSVWGRSFVATFNWETQECCLYVDGKHRFTIPLQGQPGLPVNPHDTMLWSGLLEDATMIPRTEEQPE